jgi:hypothetical protein
MTENKMEIIAGKCPIEAGGNCPLRPQGKWIDYDNTFYKCPECGYLLEKCCPQCQTKVILPICHYDAEMRGKEKSKNG